MNNFFNNQRILTTIWKWKFHFIVVGILSFILAVIVSSPLVMKPKYKSSARLYPVGIREYSEESESEQLLEIFNSRDVAFELIDMFDLGKVYDINPEDKYYQTNLLATFDKNINFKKTNYETIEVTVMDESPERACAIVDSALLLGERNMHRLKVAPYVARAEESKYYLDRQLAMIDSLQDVSKQYADDYGFLNFTLQVERATEGYYRTQSTGRASKEAKKILEDLGSHGYDFITNQEEISDRIRLVDTLRTRYELNMIKVNSNRPYSVVVEKPFVSDKKAYPVRWLVAFLIVLPSLFAALLVALAIDYRNEQELAS